MPYIVTKFGGTSVSSLETWQNIAQITHNHIAAGFQPVVVCSALTQISNKLEQVIEAAIVNQHQAIQEDIIESHRRLAQALGVDIKLIDGELDLLNQWLMGISFLRENTPKTHARILSLGEIMMTRLGHAFLNKQGIHCHWLDARDALTAITLPGGDKINYLAARCEGKPNKALQETLLKTKAQAIITQGFFAKNEEGETVLLGRGGSDTSGALFAALLQAQACEIWTDVPGIYTANPHQFPHARLLIKINYAEAQEIATMGKLMGIGRINAGDISPNLTSLSLEQSCKKCS